MFGTSHILSISINKARARLDQSSGSARTRSPHSQKTRARSAREIHGSAFGTFRADCLLYFVALSLALNGEIFTIQAQKTMTTVGQKSGSYGENST